VARVLAAGRRVGDHDATFRSGSGLVLRAHAPAPQPNGTLTRPITK